MCNGLLQAEESSEILEEAGAEERKKEQTCHIIRDKQAIFQEILDKYSSLTKIERVLTYCLRFVINLRGRSSERELGRLTSLELQRAHRRLIVYVQSFHFLDEISALQRHRDLKISSKLLRLHQFFDEQGLLRAAVYNIQSYYSNKGIPSYYRQKSILKIIV